MRNENKVTRKILKVLGILNYGTKGWKTEVTLTSWNEKPAKLDIRSWDKEYQKMGKGISLDKNEAIRLRDILISLNLGEAEPLQEPVEVEPVLDFGDFEGLGM